MSAVALAETAAPLRVGIFDTAISTDNLGDIIIMDAVMEPLAEIFGGDARMERIATHAFMPKSTLVTLAQCDLSIVGGTNILKSHMFYRANWRLRPWDALAMRNVVLMGVGWQHYQRRDTDIFSRLLFDRILSKTFDHSVRDEYTLEKMHRQVKNIIYTACPTLWPLTAERCAGVPTTKARSAVVSLTYYRPHGADAELLALLRREYETVYFWCQQADDRAYLESLGSGGKLSMLSDIESYNRVLDTEDVDVIGTRLHGGIRALQRGRRALILAVDNRAAEMARSTNIPVIHRQDLATIRKWIETSDPVSVTLPWDAIAAWKGQFANFG